MISKADLALWLSALSVLLNLHVAATGIVCLLLGALLGRTRKR